MAEHCKISASLVAESEERSYILKVDDYWRAKALLKTGEFLDFAPFSVGGHSWAVNYFPNGRVKKDADLVLYFFVLIYSAGASTHDDVKAKFTFNIVDKNGEAVPFSRTHPVDTFTSKGSCIASIKQADLERSVYLRDDCLILRCDVTVTKEIQSEVPNKVPPTDLHQHLVDLLKSKDAADVTFQVGGRSFSAHRCVLAARSSVFKAELLGAMKENSPGSPPIEICDMEADVFESLLHFIYSDSVPTTVLEGPSNNGDSRVDLVMAGHLLVAADRYNIGRLKLICEEKLCNHIDSDMVATSLALAEQHGFGGLKEACLKFLLASPSNLEAMMASDGFEHLKSSCPSVLKELVARTMPAELKATKDLIMAIW